MNLNKKITLNIVFLLFSTYINASNYIEEGFVTFATESYFPVLEVLIQSVHEFSTRPIVAFGINADIPFSNETYPRLIKKRIDVDLNKINIFYQKPRIILESSIKYGIYVEADDIVTQWIDNLFQQCKKVKSLPLCPIHPTDPNNQQNIMHYLGVHEKSMPYVHAHIIFAQDCMPFIREWYNTCLECLAHPNNYDETILNVLLWKHKAKEYLDPYDLYFTNIETYIKGKKSYYFDESNQYNALYFYMLHGCKDPIEAHSIFELLKKHKHLPEYSIR